MSNKRTVFSTLAGLSLALSLTANTAIAQMSGDMPSDRSASTSQFRSIEQPLSLKIGVALGGVALIGLELWWFLSKTKSQKAQENQGVQEMTITVDGGYEPSRVVVSMGQPVRLNFDRKDPSSCLEKVVFPDFHIAQELNLNQVTAIEFTPEHPGEYTFACGMNMFRGVVEVQPSEPSELVVSPAR